MGLGTRIRQIRHAKKLTIVEVGGRAGLSASYVSQVEREVANPSVGTVNRIAKALGVGMSVFFEGPERADLSDNGGSGVDKIPTRTVRREERKSLTYPGSHIRHELLIPDLRHNLEVLLSRAPPGSDSGEFDFSHEGEECGVVLSGTVELTVGEHSYILEAGDTIRFDGKEPHAWKNVGSDELEVIWIMTPPHF